MFKTPLQVEAIPPNLWRIISPLVWDDTVGGVMDNGVYIPNPGEFGRLEFPAGLVTDLASIPRILRHHSAFDPGGPSRRAAVGHDDMYATGMAAGKSITRDRADRFLYLALLSEGVSRPVAWMFWAGVRLGGWLPWRDYRIAELEAALEAERRRLLVAQRDIRQPVVPPRIK